MIMFGFGYKSKVKKIVEDELSSFVSPMFSGRFSNVVSEAKSNGVNEYSSAIEFVLQITEHLESVWSEESGKVTKESIIEDITERCNCIKKVMGLSDIDNKIIIERVDTLLNKISPN
tara:strand:- start:999 stop:1349 length:351 start_codon:yes stop_codon:yes gene_type:complete